ncbi:hypothetical protein Nepgr_028710 [Nepenthes gracilis]|uniref:Uncharacterized protein n=1 Tax=Nepenthes gracilis TaxID=150966 RepID=A0AAD3TE81_NEPGR|nr:hypothetical protein Nepgr_028710 [Nepenthes gracilis]
MEGVGARLGRSSSRYGTTTVFSGPVRKWKKKWVHVTPSSNNASSNRHIHHSLANGTNNSVNGSHLLLYKWTPISQSNNNNGSDNNVNNNEDKNCGKDNVTSPAEEPPKRKFKYIPIALLEEQEKETEESSDDEAKQIDGDTSNPTSKNSAHGEKPDINDLPMEESQDPEQEQTVSARQDLNISTLHLSLGLTLEDEDRDPESKTNRSREGKFGK